MSVTRVPLFGIETRMLAALLAGAMSSAISAEQPKGDSLYVQRCAACHDNATGRMPTRAALRELPPESIVISLTNGAMVFQATGMSREEIRAVAGYVSSKPFGGPQVAMVKPNPCTSKAAPLIASQTHWSGWGRDLENTRYQPDPGLKASDLPRLKLKWAYAYDGRFAQGQPTLVGDRVLVSDTLGKVSALDTATGCERWTFQAAQSVKVAISVAQLQVAGKSRAVAFFGDERAAVYALDATTGELLWRVVVDDHAVARIVGAPAVHEGRLYVPVSAAEEAASRDPKYSCCTFRGSIVAMNAASGAVIWKTHAIAAAPKPTRLNSAGSQMYGPAGAAIWSAPTIDVKRRLIYAATGNSYTDVVSDATNAIVAFDLATGARTWVRQMTANDNFVTGCAGEGNGNCPQSRGPDHDFGASVVIKTTSDGRQLLLAGQKSGVVHALDPDQQGRVVWQVKAGHGTALGGIEWGLAVDERTVYVPNSDASNQEQGRPGLTALRIQDGKSLWHVPTPKVECSWGAAEQCRRGQPAAATVIPGVVFSGALDGHMRAYAADTGKILWDVDTAAAVQTVNGGLTAGGAIDQAGPTVANGVLYVNSGYGRWGKPGRLLLAFSVDGR